MIGRSLTLAAAIFGAFLASQAPEFTQQYRQRLGGAVDELQRVVADFDADASTAGLDRSQALVTMTSAKDTLVHLRGVSMEAAIDRYDRLKSQMTTFDATGLLGRIGSILTTPDTPLVKATFADYAPAVPTTPAGFVTAGGTFLIVYVAIGLARLGAYPFVRRRRRRIREEEEYYARRGN